jgi:hypothetical protein
MILENLWILKILLNTLSLEKNKFRLSEQTDYIIIIMINWCSYSLCALAIQVFHFLNYSIRNSIVQRIPKEVMFTSLINYYPNRQI